jgi:heme oxygenase-like protein
VRAAPLRRSRALTSEPRTSVRLRRKIALVVEPYAAACTTLVESPRLRELWPEFLVLQHQIIRATVPLTVAALEESRALLGDDPLAEPLAAYLEEHVDEELHHDQLLDDLDLLGLDRMTVLGRMPPPEVATLVGCQYYWLHHFHPLAFLGYIGFMEGYPPTPELVETLIERTDYPRPAFQTFAEHAELDPGHRDHLDRVLDALPLTQEQETVLGVSAMTTAGLATRALREVLDSER